MGLDKFLKVPRLTKHRTVTNEACDAGRVLTNGRSVRTSLSAKIRNMIKIQSDTKVTKVEVLDIQKTVKRDEAKEFCCYI